MPIDSPFDSLVGIRSPFGNRRASAPPVPVSPPDAFAAGDWEFVWKESADVVPRGFDALDWEFVYREEAVPATAPVGRGDEPVISFDAATWDPYDSVMIPSMAQVGKRVFYAVYGRNNTSVGDTFAEGTGTYGRISFTDYEGDEAAAFSSLTIGCFLLPPIAAGRSGDTAFDVYMHPLGDGRLLITIPTGFHGNQDKKAAYGCILLNPLDDPANWEFGPWSYLGMGFSNAPHTHKGEVRLVTAQAPGSGYDETANAMYYKRIVPDGNVVTTEDISIVPKAPISDANQGTHEASFISFGTDSIRCTFRTDLGPYTVVSTDNGETWGTPEIVTWDASTVTEIVSKTDLERSAAGNLLWAYNSPTPNGPYSGFNRYNMTLSIHADDGFDSAPAVDFTFDTRGGSAVSEDAVSYPNILPLRNADGSDTGKILVAYDYGRGDPPSANETYICVFDEADLIANAPISDGDATYFTRYIYGP